jgi:preprotein translocase subunit SecG
MGQSKKRYAVRGTREVSPRVPRTAYRLLTLIDSFLILIYPPTHKIMRQLILSIVQLVLSVLLVAAILLQQRGGGIGAAFGGGSDVFRTKRGIEKTLHYATIAIAILFFGNAVLTIVLH